MLRRAGQTPEKQASGNLLWRHQALDPAFAGQEETLEGGDVMSEDHEGKVGEGVGSVLGAGRTLALLRAGSGSGTKLGEWRGRRVAVAERGPSSRVGLMLRGVDRTLRGRGRGSAR